MIELEKHGWWLGLYPLIYQQETVIHAEAVGWLGRAQRPGLQEVLKANFGLLFSRPLLYLSIFIRIIAGNIRSLKFLSRAVALFPKAVWMARELPINNVAHVHAHYATHPALAAWIIHQITGISYSVTVHAHDIFVDRSMLETKLREAMKLVSGRVPLEASGGVTLETIRFLAETGVDYISVGRSTQSAPAVDIGLDYAISR